jgi:hypothetical protein
MHPYLAQQLVQDRHARLRGEAVVVAPWKRSSRDRLRGAVTAAGRARRATGWVLVEIGLKLAVSVSRESA